jgi:hypothetical protein
MSRFFLLPAVLVALLPRLAPAQSFCSSDGQRQPVALLERFINADCADCWTDPKTPQPAAGGVALDWIVPGGKGQDAPLSAAASRDALVRLQALQRKAPAQTASASTAIARNQTGVRVAHGLAFNGYIGTSIEMKPARPGAWTAWLLLVETIPAGTEGSPVERNLVRNMLQPAWDGRKQLSKREHLRLREVRPMSIPEGANPERLRLVGWIEDARGRVVAAAQTRCRNR